MSDAPHAPAGLLPGDEIDLQNASTIIDLFTRAAQANRQTPGRQGASVHLPSTGRLMVSGDLHDHGPNLRTLVRLAELGRSPHHHLLLQEVIHGPARVRGMDLSSRTLAHVAALKLAHPNQVHVLMGNHELAQYTGQGILKDGANVVEAFNEGLEFMFNDRSPEVRLAINDFILSMLLTVRCESGVLCCHSLPSPRKMSEFDHTVIDRDLTREDLAGGAAHAMVWGRNHTDEQAAELRNAWGCSLFVMGHQYMDMGWETFGEDRLILNSDHDHAVALPLDLAARADLRELSAQILPLASMAL